jgi:hypothetical protein
MTSVKACSAFPVCVPGSGARTAKHYALHERERFRLIRVFDAMAGDAKGWIAGLRGQGAPQRAREG